MQLKLPWDTPLSVVEKRYPGLGHQLKEYFAECEQKDVPVRIEWRDNFMVWRPNIYERTLMAGIDPSRVFARVTGYDDETVTLEILPGHEDKVELLRDRAVITYNGSVSPAPQEHMERIYKLRLGPRMTSDHRAHPVTVKRAVPAGKPNPNTGKPSISLEAKLQRWLVDYRFTGWPALVEWGATPDVPDRERETLMCQCTIDPKRVCGQLVSVDDTTATIRLRGPCGDVARKAIEDHGERVRFFVNVIGRETDDGFQTVRIAKVYLAEIWGDDQ